jgi:hypothetical protein
MTHSIEGSIAEILNKGEAHLHEHWVDDNENVWEVHGEREGFMLRAVEGNASIPYWTTYLVSLPGLHRIN